jgi:hypothetical protein
MHTFRSHAIGSGLLQLAHVPRSMMRTLAYTYTPHAPLIDLFRSNLHDAVPRIYTPPTASDQSAVS